MVVERGKEGGGRFRGGGGIFFVGSGWFSWMVQPVCGFMVVERGRGGGSGGGGRLLFRIRSLL